MSSNQNRTALIGKKLGMSQVWDENGFFVPVTLVDVATNVVTAVKSEDTDGYKAVQLGYGAIDPTKVTKPLAGRWGFKSYRRAHGSHKNERRPGSIGACATPSRVLKGKRMAGHMGHVTHTTQGLTVVSSDAENGVVAIKGAIPGPKGAIVLLRSAVKGA